MGFLIYILDVLAFIIVMSGGVLGAELLARWLEKTYDKYIEKQKEKENGRK